MPLERVRIAGDGTTATLKFSEALDESSVPAVTSGFDPFRITPYRAVSNIAVSGSTVTLTFATFGLQRGDKVHKLQYTQPTSGNRLRYASGADIDSFSNVAARWTLGNSKVFSLPASGYSETISVNYVQWVLSPRVNAGAAFGGRLLHIVRIHHSGSDAGDVYLGFSPTATGTTGLTRLPYAVQAIGRFTLVSGSHSLEVGMQPLEGIVGLGGITAHRFRPPNSADVISFGVDVRAESGDQAATLTLFDEPIIPTIASFTSGQTWRTHGRITWGRTEERAQIALIGGGGEGAGGGNVPGVSFGFDGVRSQLKVDGVVVSTAAGGGGGGVDSNNLRAGGSGGLGQDGADGGAGSPPNGDSGGGGGAGGAGGGTGFGAGGSGAPGAGGADAENPGDGGDPGAAGGGGGEAGENRAVYLTDLTPTSVLEWIVGIGGEYTGAGVGVDGAITITALPPEPAAAAHSYEALGVTAAALVSDDAVVVTSRVDPDISSGLEALVELELDSGTKRFSISGVRGTGYYAERLLGVSPVEQALSPVPDDYRAPEVGIVLDDADNEISKLRANEAFLHRTLRVRLGRVPEGETDFTTVFEGEVRGWRSEGTEFELTIGSPFHERFEKPVTPERVVTASQFPNAHSNAVSRLVPLVIGTINTRPYGGSGAVEALLIDTTANKYAAAQDETAGSVRALNVYVDGVRATSGWSQASETFGTLRIRTITFTSDQGSASITADIQGLPDENGALSSNPVRVLRRFLIENGFAAADFDTDSLANAEERLGVLGVQAAIWATNADAELQDVLYDFTRSTNVVFYASRGGRIAADVPEPGRAITPSAILTEADVVKGSMRIRSLDKHASTLEGRFRYSPATGEYEGLGRFISQPQQTALGRDVREQVDLPYQYSAASLLKALEIRAFFMKEERALVELDADPSLYKALNIGNVVQLTHYAGLGESGFSDRLFRVISLSLRLSEQELLTGLTLIDT